MLPSLLATQVQAGLEDLLRANLNFTSPRFEGAISRFLGNPHNFLKGPWLSIDMPFRQAPDERKNFFPDVPMEFAPFAHQLKAFERLSFPNPRSTLIATGTGSGKTECFLWPAFDACAKQKNEPGIKAIIIYPMNALAGDQARRIAESVRSIPAIKHLRVGIYADSEPKPPSMVMTGADIITSREAMRQDPPDILLTNYKMLDFLMVRPKDQGLWSRNEPSTLQYLVVDELHTFDGAQGTDLALLIRRLKARLGITKGRLACVGTSATLGGDDGADDLIRYATDIFDETFDEDSIVTEDRKSPSEYLSEYPIEDTTVPESAELAAAFHSIDTLSQPESAGLLAPLFFSSVPEGMPGNANWRIALGERLNRHELFRELIRALDGKPRAYSELADRLTASSALKKYPAHALPLIIAGLAALVSFARKPGGLPFLTVRNQVWLRELARIVSSVNLYPELRHLDDLIEAEAKLALPVCFCRHCGITGWVGRLASSSANTWAPARTIYDQFFDGGPAIRFFFCEQVEPKGRGSGGVVKAYLCPSCMTYHPSEHQDGFQCPNSPHHGEPVPVWLYDPTSGTGNTVSKNCPSCGKTNTIGIAGMRAATESASIVATLFGSLLNDEPKLLMFSDSVQDAAQRAAVIETRNQATVLRKEVATYLDTLADRIVTLSELCSKAPSEFLANRNSPEEFVGTFMPGDAQWIKEYQEMIGPNDRLENGSRLPQGLAFRLGWEIFSDFTYRSRTSQSLEVTGLVALRIPSNRLSDVSHHIAIELENAFRDLGFKTNSDEVLGFLTGFLDQMRASGAVFHPYLDAAIKLGGHRSSWFGARKHMTRHILEQMLPIPGAGNSARPAPVSYLKLENFDYLARDSIDNWHRGWAFRFFEAANPLFRGRYRDFFEIVVKRLATAGILLETDAKLGDLRGSLTGGNGPVYVVNADELVATRETAAARCNSCGRNHTIAQSDAPVWQGLSCTKNGCSGSFAVDDGSQPASVYFDRLFRHGRTARVIAREHTGLLQTDDRKRLEQRFIEGAKPWHPNTLSATPTLEMGINIGALSTLLLCSVPPEQANYIQRIGRTGRRDGNSLNVTIVNARPHDLMFWENPNDMIRGAVRSPGVHLDAMAILQRQIAAFSLDCWVRNLAPNTDFGTVKQALNAIQKGNQDVFPATWMAFIGQEADDLIDRFVPLLPERLQQDNEYVSEIRTFVGQSGEGSLRFSISSVFERAEHERGVLQERRDDLSRAIRKKRSEIEGQEKAKVKRDLIDELDRELANLKREHAVIKKTISKTIEDVQCLLYLTDRGVLPNYAFPEEGIRLEASVYWMPATRDEEVRSEVFEFPRSASAALSEFAPGSDFYADGRKARIDQIDLTRSEIETWRFCDVCDYCAPEATIPDTQKACPHCGSDMWIDSGRKAEAVALKTVLAVQEASRAAIEDADTRNLVSYDRKLLPQFDERDVQAAFEVKRTEALVPFGFEFISNCLFQDFNFGRRADTPSGQVVSGEPLRSNPFSLCRHCGKLLWGAGFRKRDHTQRCPVKETDDYKDYAAGLYLYRSFRSEAARILIPVQSRPTPNDIKSFVSAIELGMRRHFKGRVDHIRATTIERKMRQKGVSNSHFQDLYLYDTVPGGTGYLKQLASNPDVMLSALTSALDALASCPCNGENEKDGCYRCVKTYRASYGEGEPSRNRAVQMLQQIVDSWGSIEKIESVSQIKASLYLDSDLEHKFLDRMKSAVGASGLFRAEVLPNGKIGHFLQFSDDGSAWTMEHHVDVRSRFGLNVPTEIDFLLTPVAGSGPSIQDAQSSGSKADGKPIAVYLDGWEYHKDRIASDFEKRMKLIRSGKMQVWSLSRNDIYEDRPLEEHFRRKMMSLPDTLQNGPLKETLNALLAHIFNNKKAGLVRPRLEKWFRNIGSRRPFQLFVDRLTRPVADIEYAIAVFYYLAGDMQASRKQTFRNVMRAAGFDPENESVSAFSRAPHFGAVKDDAVGLAIIADQPEVPILLGKFAAERWRFVIRLDQAGSSDNAAWNTSLMLINILQTFKGLHVVTEGLTLALPDLSDAIRGGQTTGWAAIIEDMKAYELDDVAELASRLQAAGAAVPDMTSEELIINMETAGTVEFGWKSKRIAVAVDRFKAYGWTVFSLTEYDAIVRSLTREGVLND